MPKRWVCLGLGGGLISSTGRAKEEKIRRGLRRRRFRDLRLAESRRRRHVVHEERVWASLRSGERRRSGGPSGLGEECMGEKQHAHLGLTG